MNIRCRTMKVLVITGLCSIWISSGVAAREHSYTATAAVIDNPGQEYVVRGQVNKPFAAERALSACREANTQQATSCELIRLDGAPLTTSSQIKSKLPKGPHPLFLWKYTTEQSTVFLAGSVHILKETFYPLPAPYSNAFDLAQTVVVEVDISSLDPNVIRAKTLQYGMLQEPQQLSTVLPPNTFLNLKKLGAQYGLPITQMGRFKPAMISQQLAVLALLSVGYSPESGVENHFLSELGPRKVEELESLDFQLDVLMNQPIDMQVALMKETLNNFEDFETHTADLLTAYLAGDLDAFESAFNSQSGSSELTREYLRRLMDDRNVKMAEKIQGYLTRGAGTYFVLIGAGHYIGPNNIIELLQKSGLEGLRLQSNSTL